MGTDNLASVLASASVVLFDFDGPLCDVFAGRPAPQVARELAQLADDEDLALMAKLSGTGDPLEVLRLAHAANCDLGHAVERALTEAEMDAVKVAGNPTPGATSALELARATGRGVAVVSNNSAECVRSFLDQHGISQHVEEIVGRPRQRPDLMKPNPYSLTMAARLLGVDVTTCVLVGDSLTDIQAAHAVGSAAIGYANKPGKRQAFTQAGAESVIESMNAIGDALRPLESR